MEAPNANHPILLVEDNPLDVDLTLRAFARRKLTNPILIARNGEEAIQWIEKWEQGSEQPVVVLLDLKLPKISGLEVLEVLKKHPKYYAIPVVVLTTSSENDDVKKAYELGANSYIVKPVDFDKFVDVAATIEIYWTIINHPSPSN
jgi:CheY-like chemotaxis protein